MTEQRPVGPWARAGILLSGVIAGAAGLSSATGITVKEMLGWLQPAPAKKIATTDDPATPPATSASARGPAVPRNEEGTSATAAGLLAPQPVDAPMSPPAAGPASVVQTAAAPSPSPIRVEGLSASISPGRSYLAPDLIGYDATATVRVTNASDRLIGVGWFRGGETASLRLETGQILDAGAEADRYKGIPNCGGTRPTTCGMDQLVALAPGESAVGTIVFRANLPPGDHDAMLKAGKAAFAARMAINPGGTQEPYGKAASVEGISLSNNIR